MNDGFVNEKILREYINKNSITQYNENIKNFLKFLFEDNFNPSLEFLATKEGGQVKPDLCISHNNIKKYVSLKKGSGNSVHQEKTEQFFSYIENNFELRTLNNLKLFHYGDDTLNDTGEIRYNASECKSKYKNEIFELNSDFNTDINIIKFLDRFLFIGNVGNLVVDAIYHGTIEKGLWANRDEIIEYSISNSFSINAVHFGPLTYQVWGRNEKRLARYPERRYVMQVKWGSIVKDLVIIRKVNK